MAISLIVGDPGVGKTMLLTWFVHMNYQSPTKTIYANYNLYGIRYESVDGLNDLGDIGTPDNFIALDEGWLSADSRRAGSVANVAATTWTAQHRKFRCDVCISTQDEMQVDTRIRKLVTISFRPSILFKDAAGVPSLLKVDVRIKDSKSRGGWAKGEFIVPLYFRFSHGMVNIPFSYNTYQRMQAMEYSLKDANRDLIDKYRNFDGKASMLATILMFQENMQKEAAANLARFILAVKMGYVDPDEESDSE